MRKSVSSTGKVMNPPFVNSADIAHVRHAYSLLKPGGRLVAIVGEGAFFRQDAKATAFRDWVEARGGTEERLPEGTFLDPSLPVTTGANARLLVLEAGPEPTVEAGLSEDSEANQPVLATPAVAVVDSSMDAPSFFLS